MLLDEWDSIAQEMEEHHALFYTLHRMGRPVFNDQIDTACVRWDKEGNLLSFEFNPKFWEGLTRYEKKFVFAHECLHVILEHGARAKDTKDMRKANIAMDVVVNHLLVDRFGFVREQIRDWKQYCWTDTVTDGEPSGKSFEHYIGAIENDAQLVDSHGTGDMEDVLKRLRESLSDGEIADAIEKMGDDAAGDLTILSVGPVAKKKKWETVIRKWTYRLPKAQPEEQWVRLNRRFAMLNTGFILPSEMEEEVDIADKARVWFFQDTSGSCKNFQERFFKAAASLPPARFDVKLHCFDSRVYETTLESGKIYGGGATLFSSIEKYIQGLVAQGEKYPDVVFVVTDGQGNRVTPEIPSRWHWFLSEDVRRWIPKGSHVHSLRDYE